MLIQIPADLTIVTLRDARQTYAQRYKKDYAEQIFAKASEILEAKTNIRFTKGECTEVTEDVAPGIRADAVDLNGFHYLTARFKAGRGVRVIFVDKLSQAEIGGRSREEKKMAILPYEPALEGMAIKLAHEFGHLLGVEKHIDEGGISHQPGNESAYSQMRDNLMYSQGLSNKALLTSAQIGTMRTSRLARQFGGTTIGDMFIPEILKSLRRM